MILYHHPTKHRLAEDKHVAAVDMENYNISCPSNLLAGTILGDAAPTMKMTLLLPATFIAASLQDCLLLLLHPGITAAATSHCYYCLLRFLATATLLFPTVAATSYCTLTIATCYHLLPGSITLSSYTGSFPIEHPLAI